MSQRKEYDGEEKSVDLSKLDAVKLDFSKFTKGKNNTISFPYPYKFCSSIFLYCHSIFPKYSIMIPGYSDIFIRLPVLTS